MDCRSTEAGNWLAWLVPGVTPAHAELVAADWPAVAAASRSHHVAATLYARLRAGDRLALVPDPARATLQNAYQHAVVEALVWQRALRLILPALASESITAVPYKGAALAFLAYDDAAERSMSDIDLWIDHEDMQRACLALERLGFERREDLERPIAFQALCGGEIPFSGRRIGVPLVELQWSVFPGEWLRRTACVDHAGVRNRLVSTTLFDTSVRILAAEDQLIQAAVHAAISHVFSQAAVRSLLDLVVIAGRGVDWVAITQRAREWRLAAVIGHTLHLAGDLFGQPSFLAAAQELIAPRRLRQLYRFANPQSVLRHHRLDRGVAKWRYLTAAVDRDRDRLRLLARSLWPEREWLGARYGQWGMPVRFRHLAGAIRGRF